MLQYAYLWWKRVAKEVGAVRAAGLWLLQDPRRGSQFVWVFSHLLTLCLIAWVAISIDRYKGLYYSS